MWYYSNCIYYQQLERRRHPLSQNIVVTLLSVLFYITSMLGGNSATTPQTQQPLLPNQVESNRVTSIAGQTGTIIDDQVTIRSGPGTEYDPITSVVQDNEVTLLATENGWYEVRIPSGQKGWVAG